MNSTELEDVKPAARRFKARPLNRKVGTLNLYGWNFVYVATVFNPSPQPYQNVCNLQILEAPSLSLPKKSIPKLPEFQVSVPYLFPASC